MKKIAIIGGKSLIDIVFLSVLSDEYPNLDISCYGDSGSVSYGSKILTVKDAKTIEVQNYDVIIHLSQEFNFILPLIKEHNETNDKKIKYLNTLEGNLTISYLTSPCSDLILMPDYGVEPISIFLSLFKDLIHADISINQPIAELGKEALNKFHREVKESAMKVIQRGDDSKDPLAFNINYSYLEDENVSDFEDSLQEQQQKKQLNTILGESKVRFLNQARVPINKGSSAIITFALTEQLPNKQLKALIEESGILYAKHGFSTILSENDPVIYVTKLKQNQNNYSAILLFDSIQRVVDNAINILRNLLNLTN